MSSSLFRLARMRRAARGGRGYDEGAVSRAATSSAWAENECTMQTGIHFLDIVHDLEKISDHCSNIAIYTIQLGGGRSRNSTRTPTSSRHIRRPRSSRRSSNSIRISTSPRLMKSRRWSNTKRDWLCQSLFLLRMDNGELRIVVSRRARYNNARSAYFHAARMELGRDSVIFHSPFSIFHYFTG